MTEVQPRVWRVDVHEQTLKHEPILETWKRLGGRGLLDEVDAKCDPENKLIFAPGLLVGHMLSSTDRFLKGFQSSFPMQGMACDNHNMALLKFISIYTSAAGAILARYAPYSGCSSFQSTLPVKGVTATSGKTVRMATRCGQLESILYWIIFKKG